MSTPPKTKHLIITAIVMFILTYSLLIIFDAQVTEFINCHRTGDEISDNQIIVNGDGSSGTGDVTNNNPTKIVQGETRTVTKTVKEASPTYYSNTGTIKPHTTVTNKSGSQSQR